MLFRSPIKAHELQQLLQHYADAKSQAQVGTTAGTSTTRYAAHNFDYAQAMTRVDQEVLHIIAQPFVDQWPVESKKIQDGLQSGDLKTVLHAAHALKGTLAMFGAKPASELATQLEKFASQGDINGACGLLEPLIGELNRLISVIPLEKSH